MRIRTVKPEFWSSPTVARLSLRARLLFSGLWYCADAEGRGLADAGRIRRALFPWDDEISDAQVDGSLRELASQGLIRLYSRRLTPTKSRQRATLLYQVTSWDEHQIVNRPTPSRLPPAETRPRNHGVLTESSRSAHGGKEG